MPRKTPQQQVQEDIYACLRTPQIARNIGASIGLDTNIVRNNLKALKKSGLVVQVGIKNNVHLWARADQHQALPPVKAYTGKAPQERNEAFWSAWLRQRP